MLLSEFLASPSVTSLPRLKEGKVKSVREFYFGMVVKTLPSVEAVEEWDKLLNEYINEESPLLFVRKYCSGPNHNNLRRGFLTRYPSGLEYVFCDNFLAQYFYAMAREGFVPKYSDFKKTLSEKRFPFGYVATATEKELSALPAGKSVFQNQRGWHLAHLFPVNQEYEGIDYVQLSAEMFPKGERTEWHRESEFFVRNSKFDLTTVERAVLNAHFLRLVHPVNQFLVPASGYEQGGYSGSIGELASLIEYCYFMHKEMYRPVFEQFERTALVKKEVKNPSFEAGSAIIDIQYGGIAGSKTSDAVPQQKEEKPMDQKSIHDDAENDESEEKPLVKIKIGKYVRKSMREFSDKGRIDSLTVGNLKNGDYCKHTFNINYPLLKKVGKNPDLREQTLIKGVARYWKDLISINGSFYFLCSQWYEKDRERFIKWEESIKQRK